MPNPTRAASYQRISYDRSGDSLGVARQLSLNKEWAANHGWTLTSSFTDNSMSGYTAESADRPAWNNLLTAIGAGEVDGVVLYALDRASRRTRDLLDFVDLLEKHDVPLGVVTSSIDYSTSQGRLMLTLAAGIAENEVRLKGDRQRAAAAQGRELGKVYYRYRSFGWVDRERQELEPVEAEMIRSATEALLSGATVGEVRRAWDAIGRFTPRPTKDPDRERNWTAVGVKQVLMRPANAALIQHNGEIVGKGNWTPILTEDELARLQALFATKNKRAKRSPSAGRDYLLSGVLRCGKDGVPMRGGGLNRGNPVYRCSSYPKCYTSIKQAVVETTVLDWARDRLSTLTVDDVMPPASVAESVRLSEELLELQSGREEAAATDGLSPRGLALLLANLDRRETHLRDALAKVSRDSVLAAVVSKAQDWDELTMQQQRTLLDQMGVYVVAPGPGGAKRVGITPKEPKRGGLFPPEGLEVFGDGDGWEPSEDVAEL